MVIEKPGDVAGDAGGGHVVYDPRDGLYFCTASFDYHYPPFWQTFKEKCAKSQSGDVVPDCCIAIPVNPISMPRTLTPSACAEPVIVPPTTGIGKEVTKSKDSRNKK